MHVNCFYISYVPSFFLVGYFTGILLLHINIFEIVASFGLHYNVYYLLFYITLCVCVRAYVVCVCVRAYVVCVCVCVCERERETV